MMNESVLKREKGRVSHVLVLLVRWIGTFTYSKKVFPQVCGYTQESSSNSTLAKLVLMHDEFVARNVILRDDGDGGERRKERRW